MERKSKMANFVSNFEIVQQTTETFFFFEEKKIVSMRRVDYFDCPT